MMMLTRDGGGKLSSYDARSPHHANFIESIPKARVRWVTKRRTDQGQDGHERRLKASWACREICSMDTLALIRTTHPDRFELQIHLRMKVAH